MIFLIVLFLTTQCFAQDIIFPADTLLPIVSAGFYVESDTFYSETHSECAWLGVRDSSSCGTQYKYEQSDEGFSGVSWDYRIEPWVEDYFVQRAIFLYNIEGYSDISVCSLYFESFSSQVIDACSLVISRFVSRSQESCEESKSSYMDSCNFYQCGSTGSLAFPVANATIVPLINAGNPVNLTYSVNKSILSLNDTTAIGVWIRSLPLTKFRPIGFNKASADFVKLLIWKKELLCRQNKWSDKNGFGQCSWGQRRWSQ